MRRLIIALGIGTAFLLLSLLGFGLYFTQALKPVDAVRTTTTTFVIPRGQALATIAGRLQSSGIIRHAWAFRYIVWRDQLQQKIQAGSFLLSPAMSVDEVAHQLTTGTNDVWITVLEGWRVEEIADMLATQPLTDVDRAAFLAAAKPDEGYLFPDSYLVPRAVTATQVVSLLKRTFEKKVTQGLADSLAKSSLPLSDVVTLASIVEREAKEPTQMRLVARVLLNRLKIDMGLGVDATLQYAKGYDERLKTWWPQPLAADRALTSTYNTYKFAGLPSGPICNPGLAAIQAVLLPAETSALYYLHDAAGEIHLANTLEEHTANIHTYLR